MNDQEVAARVQIAIGQVAASDSDLAVVSGQVRRGWGGIVFVRLRAGGHEPEARPAVESRLREAVTRALEPERCSVVVSWRR